MAFEYFLMKTQQVIFVLSFSHCSTAGSAEQIVPRCFSNNSSFSSPPLFHLLGVRKKVEHPDRNNYFSLVCQSKNSGNGHI